ncbi:MAG: homoserine kinase [Coriobacteriales bacterium]|nr:homoserine kinase [Coriobacteriales bacterium]
MGAAFLVPASSANLGPGFDSFGLALDLHNRFEAELAEDWSVEIAGEGAEELPTDATNNVVVAMARAFEEAGKPELRAAVGCANFIPPGSGLGSSAAAIVGGLLLGESLAEAEFGDERLIELATELEGHPDNIAAALLGAFTVCYGEAGRPRCARFEPARGLAVVAVAAAHGLATSESRRLLPAEVPHKDAAFNAGHAGLLAAAIATGRPELLGPALADRLHQPYRAEAVGDFESVRDILLDAGAAGVALSGAGPTVIGLVAADTDEAAHAVAVRVASRAADEVAALGGRRPPQAMAIDRAGARRL